MNGDRPVWHDFANCRTMPVDMFFPADETLDDEPPVAARIACNRCEVLDRCREWSIDEPHGFFAGRTAAERSTEIERRTIGPTSRRRHYDTEIETIAAAIHQRIGDSSYHVDLGYVAREFDVPGRIVWAACQRLADRGHAHMDIGKAGNRIMHTTTKGTK